MTDSDGVRRSDNSVAAPWLPTPPALGIEDPELYAAVRTIGVDALTPEVLDALATAGVEPALDQTACARRVALQAAPHLGYGEASQKARDDLRRAVAKAPPQMWENAVALARKLRAEPQMSRGLHAIPEGSALASRLGLPAP